MSKGKKDTIKNVFREGAIAPSFIAESIAKHQHKTNIGAHDIFLGQVRADEIDGKVVSGIDYSAYEDMANEKFHEIKEDCFETYDLSCLHIYHSKSFVPVGGICLFVFVSSAHRRFCFEALEYLVERIKVEVPIFGKEMFEGDDFQWKTNK